MDGETSAYLQRVNGLGQAVIVAMQQALDRLEAGDIRVPALEQADFSLSPDPAAGGDLSLTGLWRDTKGYLVGSIVFHADGSFYAEYNVALPHPKKRGWFVDMMTAWGREGTIKTEPQLLAAL